MSAFEFFVGLHQPSDVKHFKSAFVSVNRLKKRKKPLPSKRIILDSGAFTNVFRDGGYPDMVATHAFYIRKAKALIEEGGGELLAAVAQDYMCEAFIVKKTGLTVVDHQRLTIERYEALISYPTGVPIMPVLQGYTPQEYVDHMRMYGDRLKPGMWVGVGSVCKRNGDVRAIEEVLLAIHAERSDLRLHGFGLKTTALSSGLVRALLFTADSMSWSFAARKQGRNANDWREAMSFVRRIDGAQYQYPMFLGGVAA